jgi:hypothetical protein
MKVWMGIAMTDFNEHEIEEHLRGPDILETLRWLATDRGWQGWVYEVAERAAHEIERLRDAVDVLARAADDDGARSDLDDVIDALGFDRSQLEAELDTEMPEWEAKRNGAWHSD